MQTSDLVLIWSTMVLAGTALIAPHVYDWIKRRLYAPKLEIDFSHEPPYCHQTNLKVRAMEMSNNKPTGILTICDFPAYYCKFIVHNKGKSQAKLCEVILEELWIADSAGTYHKEVNFSPVNLTWVEFEEQHYVNINPERKISCDIGHLSSPEHQKNYEFSRYAMISKEDQQKLKFFFGLLINYKNITRETPPKYFAQRDSLVPGNYKIKVVIYSENTPKCEKMFQISWSGVWKDTEKEMFRELVIKSL